MGSAAQWNLPVLFDDRFLGGVLDLGALGILIGPAVGGVAPLLRFVVSVTVASGVMLVSKHLENIDKPVLSVRGFRR